MHEEYFNALRVRVEELRPLLQKVARRETVVQERIDLEHLQMNPERLTARGPNAREERLVFYHCSPLLLVLILCFFASFSPIF